MRKNKENHSKEAKMSVYLLIMEKPYLHKALSLRSPIAVSSLPTKWSSLILIIDVNAAMAIIKTKRSMHVVRCHRDYQGWARQNKMHLGLMVLWKLTHRIQNSCHIWRGLYGETSWEAEPQPFIHLWKKIWRKVLRDILVIILVLYIYNVLLRTGLNFMCYAKQFN